MNSNDLIDAVKQHLGVTSDNALARKHLKLDPTAIRDMRLRGLSEERALEFAEMAGLNAEEVLPAIRAERAKDPKVKKTWERIAKKLHNIAALVAGIALLYFLGVPIDSAQASGAFVMGTVSPMYIMSNCTWLFWRCDYALDGMGPVVMATPLVLSFGACAAPSESQPKPTLWQANCLHACLPGAGDVRTDTPDEFVMSDGQSNNHGIGDSTQLPTADLAPIPNVIVFFPATTGAPAHWETYQVRPDRFGPEHSFVKKWVAANPGKILGLIKVSVGNTTMGDWQPAWTEAEAYHPEWGSLYAVLIGIYREAGSPPLIAILHCQGEGDTRDATLAAYYPSRFQSFVSMLRADTGTPPFVIALTSHDGPYIADVAAAQAALGAWAGVYVVATADLGTVDGTHYDTAGNLVLGERLYDAVP